MDPTIVGAIIGAVALIAATLIGLVTNTSRNRKQAPTADTVDAAVRAAVQAAMEVLEARISEAEEPEEREFLQGNLERVATVEAPPTGQEVTVYPANDVLNFVVQQGNPRPAFNVAITLANNSQEAVLVDGLVATLTSPEGETFRFPWNLFYGYELGGLRHTISSYSHPVTVPAESSIDLGIQFIGPDLGLDNLYSWPPGKYQLDITGWINQSPGDQPANLASRFYVDISPSDIAQLKIWIGWRDEDWARFPHPDFPDPDKAAGLPVHIFSG